MDFKIGDVVRLKSGGPAMTVIRVDGRTSGKYYGVVLATNNGVHSPMNDLPAECLERCLPDLRTAEAKGDVITMSRVDGPFV